MQLGKDPFRSDTDSSPPQRVQNQLEGGLFIDPEWSYTNAGGKFAPDINAIELAGSLMGRHTILHHHTGRIERPQDWETAEEGFIDKIMETIRERMHPAPLVYIRMADQFAARSARIANTIRSKFPGAILIGGGSLPSKLARGPKSIHEALFEGQESPFDAFGVSYAAHARILEGRPWEDQIDTRSGHFSEIGKPLQGTQGSVAFEIPQKDLIYPIRTSTGCPWTAICTVPCTDIDYRSLDGQKRTTRQARETIHETLEHAAQLNPQGILFLDLSFAFDLERLKIIDQEMPPSLRSLPKTCYANAADLTKSAHHREKIELLKRLGIRAIFTGLERHTSEKLARTGGYERLQALMEELGSAGIAVTAGWIVGWPDETYEEAQKTVAMARKLAEIGIHPAPQALDTRQKFKGSAAHLLANGSFDVPLGETALKVWKTVGGDVDFTAHVVESVLSGLLISGLNPVDLPADLRFGASAMSVREVAMCLSDMLGLNGFKKLSVLGEKKDDLESVNFRAFERAKENFLKTNFLHLSYGVYFIYHYGELDERQRQKVKETSAEDLEQSVQAILGKRIKIQDLTSHLELKGENFTIKNIGIMPIKPFREKEGEAEVCYRGKKVPREIFRGIIEAQTTDGILFSGEIYDNEGNRVGEICTGIFKKKNGERQYQHLTVNIKIPRMRNNGIKTRLYEAIEAFCRRHEVEEILIEAVNAGVYLASKNMEFPDEQHALEVQQFKMELEEALAEIDSPDLENFVGFLERVGPRDYFRKNMIAAIRGLQKRYGIKTLTLNGVEVNIEDLEHPIQFARLVGDKQFKLKFTETGALESLEEAPDGVNLGKAALLSYSSAQQEKHQYDGFVGIKRLKS